MELIRKQLERYEPISIREEIVEASLETVIPDTYSDVMRVIAAYGNVNIKDKNIQTDRVTMSGMCCVQMLCATENTPSGELITVNIPVSHVVSIPGCKVDSIVLCDLTVTECIPSIVNSRKVSVKVKMQLCLKAYNQSTVHLTTGVTEEENTHCLYKEFHDECVSEIAEKPIRLVENIVLESETVKPFRWDVQFISEDVKVVKDKVMIRGSCQLRVLFIDSNSGEFVREKYHLPFSSVVDNTSFENIQTVDVEYNCQYGEITVSNSASGYILNCDISADMVVTAKMSVCENILADIFSSKYESQINSEKMEGLMKIGSETIKEGISNVFETVSNADKVCDFTYSVISRTSGKTIYVLISVRILYKDAAGETYYAHCQYDFEHNTDNVFCEVKTDINDISLQCTENGNIRMEAEAVFNITYGNTITTEQIIGYTVLKDAVKTKRSNATLILRNTAKNETVWDIAKKYNTSPEAIRQANKMEADDKLTQGKLIMIPIVK